MALKFINSKFLAGLKIYKDEEKAADKTIIPKLNISIDESQTYWDDKYKKCIHCKKNTLEYCMNDGRCIICAEKNKKGTSYYLARNLLFFIFMTKLVLILSAILYHSLN